MPLNIPTLDDRNFDELVREAVVRIPVHTPEWNNFNDSDPGMTFVQLIRLHDREFALPQQSHSREQSQKVPDPVGHRHAARDPGARAGHIQ